MIGTRTQCGRAQCRSELVLSGSTSQQAGRGGVFVAPDPKARRDLIRTMGLVSAYSGLASIALVAQPVPLLKPLAVPAAVISTGSGAISTMGECGWFGPTEACGTSLAFLGLGIATLSAGSALRLAKPTLSEFATDWYSGASQLQIIDSGMTIFGG